MSVQASEPADATWRQGSRAPGPQGSGVVVLPRQVARCLRFVAEHPGASSVEVQHGVGIKHPSQVHRVMAGLKREGLALTVRDQRSLNAWTVTQHGAEVLSELPEALYD